MTRKHTPQCKFGFSIIDVVVVTAIVAIVASVSIPMAAKIRTNAKTQKITSDANTLNRAVKFYLVSGGNLDGIESAEEVLEKLGTSASAEVAKLVPGYTSSFVDQRITTLDQTDKEGASGDPRARWDTAKQIFVVENSGPAGIKKFVFNKAQGDSSIKTEDRNFAMLYSDETDWIWDYQEAPKTVSLGGGTQVVLDTNPEPIAPTPINLPPVDTPGNSVETPLSPPSFSIPGGTYTIGLFDLSLSLVNHNPPGVSKVVYSVNSGPWLDAASIVSVEPNSTIIARAVPTTSGWTQSSQVSDRFNAEPAKLIAPFITADYDSFGLFFDYDITVELIDSNPEGSSISRYRVNGGQWKDYTGPVFLEKDYYPNGATFEARSFPLNPPYWLESLSAQKILGMETLDLVGETSGTFHNPQGPSGMISNLGNGNSGSYFNWGNGDGWGRSKSWMDFSSATFGDIAMGERFHLGDLQYYNGTIASGSGADTVDFDIGLSLDINGNTFNPLFGFSFDLINSANTDDEWASADYVKLAGGNSTQTVVINNYELEFQLEFGETTANGFSQFDEFHVLENRDASVNLYGSLVSIGRVDEGEDNEDETDSDSGEDQAVMVAGLLSSARDGADIAESASSDAKDAKDEAVSAADRVSRYIDRGKLDRARQKASKSNDEALIAETAAQNAEEAAAIAVDAAEQLNDIATEDPSVASEAEEAANLALQAEASAVAAREDADTAASAAANAAALVANLP